MDNELLLADRLGVIQTANRKYDLEHNAYLSFSGGKDSTLLHYLLDEALPNNRIPRVYLDTGIEYLAIREFVMSLAKDDDRFIIVKPTKPIKPTLEKYGYPFKSKEHSLKLSQFQKGLISPNIEKYMRFGDHFACPKSLSYQFSKDFALKVSDRCCYKMKKEPAHRWEKENHKSIAITGMRREEGGQRANIKGCIITDRKGKVKKFHPLLVVSDEWEEWYLKERGIRLCPLYYPPFNFKRSGCKGCPFNTSLQEDLSVMALYLPKEREQCEFIWKPVYEEYRRIGYRLERYEQLKLF